MVIEAEYLVKEQQRNMHQGVGMHLKRKLTATQGKVMNQLFI
jgi:hypothetical protein